MQQNAPTFNRPILSNRMCSTYAQLSIPTTLVTSRNSDTILCIFSLDLCLPLYLVMNISMIYDYLYICLLMFTLLPIYLLRTLSRFSTAFQVIGNQLPPTSENDFSDWTYILHWFCLLHIA